MSSLEVYVDSSVDCYLSFLAEDGKWKMTSPEDTISRNEKKKDFSTKIQNEYKKYADDGGIVHLIVFCYNGLSDSGETIKYLYRLKNGEIFSKALLVEDAADEIKADYLQIILSKEDVPALLYRKKMFNFFPKRKTIEGPFAGTGQM